MRKRKVFFLGRVTFNNLVWNFTSQCSSGCILYSIQIYKLYIKISINNMMSADSTIGELDGYDHSILAEAHIMMIQFGVGLLLFMTYYAVFLVIDRNHPV